MLRRQQPQQQPNRRKCRRRWRRYGAAAVALKSEDSAARGTKLRGRGSTTVLDHGRQISVKRYWLQTRRLFFLNIHNQKRGGRGWRGEKRGCQRGGRGEVRDWERATVRGEEIRVMVGRRRRRHTSWGLGGSEWRGKSFLRKKKEKLAQIPRTTNKYIIILCSHTLRLNLYRVICNFANRRRRKSRW